MFSNLLFKADISNICKPFDIQQQWADRLVIEFCEQGEKEKQHSLPPCFDKNINKKEHLKGFLSFWKQAEPLYKSLVKLFPELEILHKTLIENIEKSK